MKTRLELDVHLRENTFLLRWLQHDVKISHSPTKVGGYGIETKHRLESYKFEKIVGFILPFI